MACINVNNQVLNNVRSDDIVAVLNSMIDEQLAKDVGQIDTELVNECVDALLAFEQEKSNKVMGLVPLMSPD